MKKTVLEQYSDILNDFFYLTKNESFPIYKFKQENHPDRIFLTWNQKSKNIQEKKQNIIEKPNISKIEKNFICKLCKNKLSGIRSFIKLGNKPILVLHYSGEYRKGKQPISKTKSNLVFNTEEEDDLFERMVRKAFGHSSRDFFFQEYPACNFNPNIEGDWAERLKNCEKFINETIVENSILAILMVGSSAILKFGKDKAHSLIGKTIYYEFLDKQIPLIVLRSPKAVLALEAKTKKFESDKRSIEYKNAKNEENSLKKQIIEELTRFKSIIQI